ncbi:MAG: DUF1127 domain-containing protein [Hyphomicrobiaceae bacterium]
MRTILQTGAADSQLNATTATLFAHVYEVFAGMRKRALAREAAANLLSQDDRMLDDIGITRADVIAAFRTSGHEDVTEVLARRRSERLRTQRAP